MDTNQATQTESARRFNEAMIDWDQLKQFGISRDYLEKSGLLDNMLKGYRTDRLVPVRCNFGSVVLVTDARLSFRQSKEGPVALAMHGIRRELEFENGYIVEFEEEIDIVGSKPMTIALTISAQILKIGGVLFEQNCPTN